MFDEDQLEMCFQIVKRINRLNGKTEDWMFSFHYEFAYPMIFFSGLNFTEGNYNAKESFNIKARINRPEEVAEILEKLQEMEERYAG